VEVDSSQCAFGQWLNSEQVKDFEKDFPIFKAIISEIKTPHKHLHQSARQIEAALRENDKSQAEYLYKNKTIPALEKIAKGFANIIAEENKLLMARQNAMLIYQNQTVPRWLYRYHSWIGLIPAWNYWPGPQFGWRRS